MPKTKLGGDQKRKLERKAVKAAAKAKPNGQDFEMADAEAVPTLKEKKEKKPKKEKKENGERVKTERKEEEIAQKSEDTPSAPEDIAATDDSPSKKRKRSSLSSDLEIDITAPEPPSKKALRKFKKHPELAPKPIKPSTDPTMPKETFPEHSSQVRSKHGVWIGNLTFSATPEVLTGFLAGEGSGIQKDEITRINLPTDPRTGRNKGFAYVDFKTEAGLQHALSLSESLVGGRRVLIKNAKDFSKRPSATAADKTGANLAKNPPSHILYLGNLDFSCTAEHVQKHFAFAGKIARVRLATFEDSGKCKGFAFVDFEDKESVKRAILGLTPEEELVYEDLEGKAELELQKVRKKRAILNARPVTMEYGVGPTARYKKRFGGKEKGGVDESDGGKRKRVEKDTRSADPAVAYSSDTRRTGAITEGKGTKITFDE